MTAKPAIFRVFPKVLWAVLLALALLLAFRMARAGAPLVALAFALLSAFAVWTYASPRTKALRYLLPGLSAFALFILLPLVYTVYIAFTNFSGEHLLSRAQVREWFDRDLYAPSPERLSFRVYPDPAVATNAYRLAVPLERDDFGRRLLVSRPFTPDEAASSSPIALALSMTPPSAPPLGIADVVAARPWLLPARFSVPGHNVPFRLVSLRQIAPRLPRWTELPSGALSNAVTAQVIVPSAERGAYVDPETGLAVGPGWRSFAGLENFRELFADRALRGAFLRIFAWNVVFALLSVLFTFLVGFTLSALLQWRELRFRSLYRTLLLLPYAIPAFIPILVFRGLFNENFGEINMLLRSLFGVAPHWFTDPFLARAMILLVNTWLGYPYMLLICSAMLQAIPDDLYEASAIDGASPAVNLFRITLPQILPPLFPLLIASFAFNFNNFSLIYLLTGGKPSIPDAPAAGSTDLLVSYTFRLAFKDSSARFAYAAAVATLLFLLVSLFAWLQLRASRPSTPSRR